MTAPERAPLGAALALLLALVSLTGPLSPALMAVAVGVVALLVGIGWPGLLELPSATGTRIVVAATGLLGALVTVLAPERFTPVSGVVMVCATGVFASFVHQMLRPERRGLTESLTGTVAGVFVSGIGACWVIAQNESADLGTGTVVTAIAAGLAATLLLGATPLRALARFSASVLVGAAVTAALAATLAGMAPLVAVLVGLVTAVGASAAQLLVDSSLVARDPLPSLAVAAVPVATVGVLAHLAVILGL